MTTEQKIIQRVAKASNDFHAAFPPEKSYEEFIAQSPQHKEYADALAELLEYSDGFQEEAAVSEPA